MSEWRDFLEGLELSERQLRALDLIEELSNCSGGRHGKREKHITKDALKMILIEEFTGVKIE